MSAILKITTNLLGRTFKMSAGLWDAPRDDWRERARRGTRGEVVAVRKNEKTTTGQYGEGVSVAGSRIVGALRCRCGAAGGEGMVEAPLPVVPSGWKRTWTGFGGWQVLCPDCVEARRAGRVSTGNNTPSEGT